MAERITNQQLYKAITNISPVIGVKLDAINDHLERLNGTVADLQTAGASRETRITVLESHGTEEREDLDSLQECVQDMQIGQAKSAAIGGIMGAFIAIIPALLSWLRGI
jgi:chromosome segregation ATPase